ncbi:hypothetical protein [Homoserinibacter gongjuensis]|uniref:Uncharacterized protein n=1 Tax=Homoserinibacter gongjuensis TaxID=1162968 RepID=A0ABQ6JXH4_9MICO|nr:hypothetical protein [Homoserinibacter gongjuensis]GMA91427.1 hypothetical protein GCM10025869_19560 [Homoserinibacter gongjuensis]
MWLASPYEIDQVSDTMPIDVVILVDAGATTLAENVGAIRRARQVLVFGDPVTQTPAPFRIGLDEGRSRPSRWRTPRRARRCRCGVRMWTRRMRRMRWRPRTRMMLMRVISIRRPRRLLNPRGCPCGSSLS